MNGNDIAKAVYGRTLISKPKLTPEKTAAHSLGYFTVLAKNNKNIVV